MAHSASHNLFIELNGTDLTIATVKKDGLVVDLKIFPLVDKPALDIILADLPEIYSDITLLIRNNNFITIPESFYSSDISEIYKLSYNLPDSERVWLDKSDYNIGIAYGVEIGLADSIAAKFSRLKIKHEATVILSKLFREVNFKQSRILISLNQETLIIYAINEGKLVLCNLYYTKANDDIFYFVMLAIEQLHLLPGETELVILGEPPNRTELFELFKNYINEINIWLED